MPLNGSFNNTVPTSTGYIWLKQDKNSSSTEVQLAEKLAESIMEMKVGNIGTLFADWLNKKNNGGTHPKNVSDALEAFVEVCIGTRAAQKTTDHKQGWVAEHLWFFLVKGSYPPGSVERVFDVGLSPTDPGGDGLVIHKDSNGVLLFKLWELKKISDRSTGTINATITKAANQLKEKGTKYIMRYVIQSQDIDLTTSERTLLNRMPDEWLAQSSYAGGGISAIGSSNKLSSPNFTQLATNFSTFSSIGALEGRTIALQSFDQFCDHVCDFIWNGI